MYFIIQIVRMPGFWNIMIRQIEKRPLSIVPGQVELFPVEHFSSGLSQLILNYLGE